MLHLKKLIGSDYPYNKLNISEEHLLDFYNKFKVVVTLENRAAYYQQALALISNDYFRYIFTRSFRTYCFNEFGPEHASFLDKGVRVLRRKAGIKKSKFKIPFKGKNGIVTKNDVFVYNSIFTSPIHKKR